MKQELIKRLEKAFADVPYPGDENIGHYEVNDFIGQKDWTQVPLGIVLNNRSELRLFSAEGFHFYLPVYIRAVLLYPEADDLCDYIVAVLLVDRPLFREWVEWVIKRFSNEQKAVVIEFMKLYPELFPDSAYTMIDFARAQLEEAIGFWQSQVT
ncbi:MAG: hypothetical protein JNM70_22655 [Anaerolineae bacterium]|nr:hypothetical protein [Anaerolineae bacterium]